MQLNPTKPTGRIVAASLALIGLLAVTVVAEPASQVEASAVLQASFSKGIKQIVAERKQNNAIWLTYTRYFPEFAQAQDIDPIVEFFRSKGMMDIRARQNGKYFRYFEFTSATSSTLSFGSLKPEDRVLFIFTTESGFSKKITSFNVEFLGWTTP